MRYDRAMQGFNLGFNVVDSALKDRDRRAKEEEASRIQAEDRAQRNEAAALGLKVDQARLAEVDRANSLRAGLSSIYADPKYQTSQATYDGQESEFAIPSEFAAGLRMNEPDVKGQREAIVRQYQQQDPEKVGAIEKLHKQLQEEGIGDAMRAAKLGDFDGASRLYNASGKDRALFSPGSKPGLARITEVGGNSYEVDVQRYLVEHKLEDRPKDVELRPGSTYLPEGDIEKAYTAPFPSYGDVVTDPSGARTQAGPGGKVTAVVPPPRQKGGGAGGYGLGKDSAWIQKQKYLMDAFGVDAAKAVEIGQMLDKDPAKLASGIVEAQRKLAAANYEPFDEAAARLAAAIQVKTTQKELGISGMARELKSGVGADPDAEARQKERFDMFMEGYNNLIAQGRTKDAEKLRAMAKEQRVIK